VINPEARQQRGSPTLVQQLQELQTRWLHLLAAHQQEAQEPLLQRSLLRQHR